MPTECALPCCSGCTLLTLFAGGGLNGEGGCSSACMPRAIDSGSTILKGRWLCFCTLYALLSCGPWE